MARKRRRARSRKEEETLAIVEKQESSEEPEETDEQPQATATKKEVVVSKATAKAAPAKPMVRKGPTTGQRMGSFLKDVRAEMKKVSWPDRERTTQSTSVVIFTLVVLSGLMALFTLICTEFAQYFFGSARGGG
jgi:preprotein translocase SecE subunit